MVVTFAPRFHVLAKPTGPICNLDCEYCFFLSKEMQYPGDRFRMADELLETYLRQLLESHLTVEVTVAWFVTTVPAGVMATRFSWGLISVGTPIFKARSSEWAGRS